MRVIDDYDVQTLFDFVTKNLDLFMNIPALGVMSSGVSAVR